MFIHPPIGQLIYGDRVAWSSCERTGGEKQMITKHTAEHILHAFTWCIGQAFLDSYNRVYGKHILTIHYQKWDYYIEEQFELMQQKPLDFIMKWEDWARDICTTYEAHQ
jgi:hypothetical protein